MLKVVYSELFRGWVICEPRKIDMRIVNYPISAPYKTAEQAIEVMHKLYDMRVELNLL